jgi:hypothetical protein
MNSGTLNFFANYRPSNFNNKLSCHFNFENNNFNNYIIANQGKDRNIITGYILPNTGDFWNKKNNTAFLSGNYIMLENIENSSINLRNFSYIISFEKSHPSGGILFSNISKDTQEFTNTNGEKVEIEYFKGFEFGITANNYLYFEYFKDSGPEISISEQKISDKSVIYLNSINNTINYGYINFNNKNFVNTRFNVLSNYFFTNDKIYIGYNPEANSLYTNNQSLVGYIDDIILTSPHLFDYELLNLSSGFIYNFSSRSEYIENIITTGVTGSYVSITGYRAVITGWERIATGTFTNPWGISVMGYVNQPLIEQIPLSGIFYLSGEINNSITRYSGITFNINNEKYLSYQNNVINFLNKIDNEDLVEGKFITGFNNLLFNKKNRILDYDRYSDSYQNLARRESFYNIFVNGQLQKSGNLIFSNLPYQQNQIIIENDYGINPQNNRLIFNNFYGLNQESSVFVDGNIYNNLYFENINNFDYVNFDVDKYDLFWNGQKLIKNIDYRINNDYVLDVKLTGDGGFEGNFLTTLGEKYGTKVLISKNGSLAIMGGPFDKTTLNGAILVYLKNGNTWTLKQKITGKGTLSPRYGYSIDVSEDENVLLVGAPGSSSSNRRGYVFVYTGNRNDGWNLKQEFSGLGSFDRFGYSVAINNNGEMFAVGAPEKKGLYIYTGNKNIGWNLKQSFEEFYDNGGSVSMNKNGSVLVSSSMPSSNTFITMYIYTGNLELGWSLQQSLTGTVSDFRPAVGDFYEVGLSMNSDNSIIALGNPYRSLGTVNIFTGNNLNWALDKTILYPNSNLFSAFGFTTSLNDSGNILIVGSPGRNNVILKTGYVFVYERKENDWILKKTFSGGTSGPFSTTAQNNGVNDQFGLSVDTNNIGNVIIIGSPNEDDVEQNSGGSFIYSSNNIILNENNVLSGVVTAVPINSDFDIINSGNPILNLNNNFYRKNTEIYVNGVRQTLNYDYLELSKHDVSSGIKIVLEKNNNYIYNNEGFIK